MSTNSDFCTDGIGNTLYNVKYKEKTIFAIFARKVLVWLTISEQVI